MAPHARPIGPFPDGADPASYDRLRRRVLWALPTGLYLLGSRAGDRRNLMTCTLVTQLAMEPKLLGVAVERDALTLEIVRAGGAFALALLTTRDREVVRMFAKPAVEDRAARTLSGLAYHDAPVTGSPLPDLAAAFLDCRLERTVDLGSHVLCVGEVVDAGFGEGGEDIEVLTTKDTRMNYGG